jgi:Trk K+ transport system NAD-binding subunit
MVGDTFLVSTLSHTLHDDFGIRLLTDDEGVAGHARAGEVWYVVEDRERARQVDDVVVSEGELVSSDTFRDVGADRSHLALVAVASDSRALLAAQHLRTTFGVETVLVAISDPRSKSAFTDVTVETLTIPSLVAGAVESVVTEQFQTIQTT